MEEGGGPGADDAGQGKGQEGAVGDQDLPVVTGNPGDEPPANPDYPAEAPRSAESSTTSATSRARSQPLIMAMPASTAAQGAEAPLYEAQGPEKGAGQTQGRGQEIPGKEAAAYDAQNLILKFPVHGMGPRRFGQDRRIEIPQPVQYGLSLGRLQGKEDAPRFRRNPDGLYALQGEEELFRRCGPFGTEGISAAAQTDSAGKFVDDPVVHEGRGLRDGE